MLRIAHAGNDAEDECCCQRFTPERLVPCRQASVVRHEDNERPRETNGDIYRSEFTRPVLRVATSRERRCRPLETDRHVRMTLSRLPPPTIPIQ